MVSCPGNCRWLLGEILVQQGWINWNQLGEALSRQKERQEKVGEILVEARAINASQLKEALELQHRQPSAPCHRQRVVPEAIRTVPRHVAYQLHIIPLKVSADELVVATSLPMNLWAKAVLSNVTGVKRIKTVLMSHESITQALHNYYEPYTRHHTRHAFSHWHHPPNEDAA